MVTILAGVGFVLGLLAVSYIVGILFNDISTPIINPANIWDIISRGIVRILLLVLIIAAIYIIGVCLFALGKLVIFVL